MPVLDGASMVLGHIHSLSAVFFLSSLSLLRRGGTSVVLIVYTLLWKHVPWVSIMDIQQTLFVHKQSLFGLGGQPISQADGLGQSLSD